MNIFGILTMIGGLAMFLYGMSVMGGGLEKMSGGKLERILESLTSNPFKAVLLGAGVTAVIQSSSATTVMVVGFVNSGIMKLSQAIRDHHGCKHWNDSYLMAFEPNRDREFQFPDQHVKTVLFFTGSRTDRYYYVYVRQGQKRKISVKSYLDLQS